VLGRRPSLQTRRRNEARPGGARSAARRCAIVRGRTPRRRTPRGTLAYGTWERREATESRRPSHAVRVTPSESRRPSHAIRGVPTGRFANGTRERLEGLHERLLDAVLRDDVEQVLYHSPCISRPISVALYQSPPLLPLAFSALAPRIVTAPIRPGRTDRAGHSVCPGVHLGVRAPVPVRPADGAAAWLHAGPGCTPGLAARRAWLHAGPVPAAVSPVSPAGTNMRAASRQLRHTPAARRPAATARCTPP
jgi:hypothetical protein